MRLHYLSDLHLRAADSGQSDRLVRYLREAPAAGDVVVLGGDIFDLFVGNKGIFLRQFSAVVDAIRALPGRGVRVHYLEGNHDFHLGEVFGEGVEVETSDFSIEFGGKRFYVSHGDLIDETDHGYRALRACTRNAGFRAFVRAIPDFVVDGIGRWSSKQSRKYNQTERLNSEQSRRLRGLYADFARQMIAEGADFVFIGHSHLRDELELNAGPRGGWYINLGFEGDKLPFARWDEASGRCELGFFS